MKRIYRKAYTAALLATSMCGIAWSQSDGVREQISVHYKRAEAALAKGQGEAAADEFKEILKLDPTNAEAYADLGVIAFKQGNNAQAKRLFVSALQHNPSLWDAKAFLGLTEVRLGQTEDGVALLERSFPRIHNHGLKIDAGVAIIRAHQESKTLGQVVDVIRDLEEANPDDPEVLYITYRAYSELASQAVANLSKRAPDSGRMHQILGEAAMTQDDFPGAIIQFKKAIAANANIPGIHYELGHAILTNSQNAQAREQAQQEFETALKADPTDYNSFYELGEIFRQESKLHLAQDDYEQALQLRPDFADAEVGIGIVLMDQGEPKKAIAHFKNATRLDPENESAHYRLARAFRAAGDLQEAKGEMLKFQKLHQTHPSKPLSTTDGGKTDP